MASDGSASMLSNCAWTNRASRASKGASASIASPMEATNSLTRSRKAVRRRSSFPSKYR